MTRRSNSSIGRSKKKLSFDGGTPVRLTTFAQQTESCSVATHGLTRINAHCHMTFRLSDGTEVEYRALTPMDAAAAMCMTSDDAGMFVDVIRLAVVNSSEVLERIAALPDQAEQTALLGTAILTATLSAPGK